MQYCDTLIRAGVIVTQNKKREILNDASVAIDNGIIQAMGPSGELIKNWHPKKTLDFSDSLLMPGLVNAHTHAAMTFVRGYADDLPLLEWLETRIFPVEARLTPEIVRMGSLLGYAEMLSCGVTSCIDMYLFEGAVLEAADLAGIRCLGGEAVFAFSSPACKDYKEALKETASLAEKYSNSRRIRVAVNPHSVYTTNEKILAECRDLALEYNLPLHIHLAESPAESENSLKLYNKRPVAWCEQNALFDCRLLAAHLVDLTHEEINILSRNNVMAIHNPSSNMKLASGISPVSEMIEAGMTVGLGTDGPASNNNLNIFQEMKLAALLNKVASNSPTSLPAGTVLDMATINGARISGYTDLGSLEPGMRADCIALDLTLPNMLPLHNPISQLVYSANGGECQMTMVEGEVVYMNGKFSRFDYDDLLKEFKALKAFAN